jgi:hypothetical protein
MDNEKFEFTRCIECDCYNLRELTCAVTGEIKAPMQLKCTDEQAECSLSPEQIHKNMYDLVWGLSEYIGGKYYTIVSVCGARRGICPKGKDGICDPTPEKACDSKHNFENPKRD